MVSDGDASGPGDETPSAGGLPVGLRRLALDPGLVGLAEEAVTLAERLHDDAPGPCPSCGAEDWARDGTAARRRGGPVQMVRCRACGRKRVARAGGPFRHPLFASETMVLAVLLRESGRTLQETADTLAVVLRAGSAGAEVRAPNRQTVGRWVKRLRDLVVGAREVASGPPVEPTGLPCRPALAGAAPQAARATPSAAAAASIATAPPQLAGRFEVLETLTGDVTGGVHLVVDRWRSDDDPPLVLKVLPPPTPGGTSGRDAGREEFELRTQLRHPNLAAVYDYGVLDDGRRWFTQERVHGVDLWQAAREAPFERVLEWLVGVLRGCAYLHDRGVLHRDLKPDNVLVARRAGAHAGGDPDAPGVPAGAARIVDLGLSVAAGSAHAAATAPSGSPAYLAPEARAGSPPDVRTDLYAVGRMFHHVVSRRLTAPDVPLPALAEPVPAWFDALLGELTASAPESRPATAVDVIDTIVARSGLRFARETEATLYARIETGGFVGRSAALAQAWRALGGGPGDPDRELGAATGARGLLVSGDAGLGKSRLLAALRQQWQLGGGTAVEGGLSAWCRAVVARLGVEHPLVRVHRGVLRRLGAIGSSTEARRAPAADLPAAPRDGMLRDRDAVLDLLAVGLPVDTLLLVDDADAVDGPTRAVLEAWLARRGPDPVDGPGAPRLALAVRDPAAWRASASSSRLAHLPLDPLDPKAMASLVAAAFGGDGGAERLTARVVEAAGGNPRFAEEILRALAADGAIGRAPGGSWRVEVPDTLPLPPGLVAAVRTRLAAWSRQRPAAVRALTAVAAVGVPVPWEVATAWAAGPDEAEPDRAVQALVDEALLSRVGGGGTSPGAGPARPRAVTVAHDGIREALVPAGGVSRAMAAAWAEALEAASARRSGSRAAGEDGGADERWDRVAVAAHGLAGTPLAAVAAMARSAERARARHDVDEALVRLEALERVLDRAVDTGGLPEAERRALAVHTLRDLDRMLRFRARHDERSVCLDRLMLEAQATQDARLLHEATALKALFWFDRGRLELASRLARGSLMAAEAHADPRSAARLTWVLAMVARRDGDAEASVRLAEQTLARLAQAPGGPRGPAAGGVEAERADAERVELTVQAHIARGNALGQLGRVERAADAFDDAVAFARRHGLTSSEIVGTMNLGICAAIRGRYGEALRRFDRARGQAQRLGWRELGEVLAANQAEVERQLGLTARAIGRLTPLVEGLDAGRRDPTVVGARATLAACLLAEGERSEAAALVALARGERLEADDPAPLALVAAELRRTEGTGEGRAAARVALARVAAGQAAGAAPHQRALAAARLATMALEEGQLEGAVAQAQEAVAHLGGASELGPSASAAGATARDGQAPPSELREGAVEVLHTRFRVALAVDDTAAASLALGLALDAFDGQRFGLGDEARAAYEGLPRHRELVEDGRRHLGRDLGAAFDPERGVEEGAASGGTAGRVIGAGQRELKAALAAGRALTQASGLGRVVELALDPVLAATGLSRGWLIVREASGPVAVGGRRAGRAPLDPSAWSRDAEAFEATLRDSGPRWRPTRVPPGRALLVPLRHRERATGVLWLEGPDPGVGSGQAPGLPTGLDATWEPLLRAVGDHAGLAVEHHLQLEELERLRREAVERLTRTRAELAEEAGRREDAERAVEAARRATELSQRYDQIVHRSDVMRRVLAQVDRLVAPGLTVFVQGESGTGKELVARALHFQGPRAPRPFVAINCGAIPETLIESELFGHVRGAFTGAVKDRRGHFELAHRGTLFLDEIGEIRPDVQVRLLRVLETREVTPVGSSKRIQVDVRIVCASNRDLEAEVAAGRFREDLYYRVATVALRLPPLRERLEDLPLLVDHFARHVAAQRGEPEVRFGPEILRRLRAHRWPGNVRELKHIVEYATLFAEAGEVPAGLSLPFGGRR